MIKTFEASSEKGSAFAETILVLIGFLVVVSFSLDGYYYSATHQTLTNIAREGAVTASTAPPSRNNLSFASGSINPGYCDHYKCVDPQVLNNPQYCGSIVTEYRVRELLEIDRVDIREGTLYVDATMDASNRVQVRIRGQYDNETPTFKGRTFDIWERGHYTGHGSGGVVQDAWNTHNSMQAMVNSWPSRFELSNSQWGSQQYYYGDEQLAVMQKILADAQQFRIEFAQFENWKNSSVKDLATRPKCPSPEFLWVDQAYATYNGWFPGSWSPLHFNDWQDANCFLFGGFWCWNVWDDG